MNFSHREGVRLKVFQSNSDYFNFCNRTLQITQTRFTLTESTILKVNIFPCSFTAKNACNSVTYFLLCLNLREITSSANAAPIPKKLTHKKGTGRILLEDFDSSYSISCPSIQLSLSITKSWTAIYYNKEEWSVYHLDMARGFICSILSTEEVKRLNTWEES